ncbi:MAG: hypothetical protein Q8K32_31325 [Archangium sp.]|nr:hypothetical protein [Archangium sp.]
MRTKSAQAVAVLANPSHSARALVTVYSSAGVAGPTWGTGPAEGQSDPVLDVEVSQDVDSFRTARVTLQRQQGLYSLAPLVITGNPLYGAEAPVFAGRRIVIEAELQLPDISNTPAGLREVIFDGYIDELAWPTDELLLVCTDKSAKLRDTWIERERVYCLAQGINAVKGAYVWRYDLPALVLNDLVVPSKDRSNGHFYKVTAVVGPQLAAEPAWPTGTGAVVVSGGVTFTEVGLTSGTTGLALETLIQQVLNDNGLGSLVTLQTPVSPGWQVKPYLQQRESVMEAITAMVNQLGWWARFEWNAGLGRYELTLAQPDRTSATVHKVLDQAEEGDCDELGLAVWDIRNVVRVIYGDSSSRDPTGAPTRITREVSDAASIAKYGRRFMEIAEDDASNIDTAAEADRMANAALADLKEPLIGTAYSFPCDFYLELGDRITLPADNLRFTTAQTLATGSLSHRFGVGGASTSVTLRGQPAARQNGWLDLEGRVKPADVHQVSQLNSTGSTLTAANVVGGQQFTVKDTGGKTKQALGQGYELHLSSTPGTSPSASTMKASGDGDSFVVSDLVPGKTYYWKVVPRSKNTDRIVRGEPSLEQTFVAGRANAGHYNSLVSQGHFPLNGNFEHASDDLALAPFDHWTVVSALTWGAAGGLFWGNDAVYGNYLDFRQSTGDYLIRSSAFPVRRMGGHFNIYMSVRPNGTVTASRRLIVYIRFYRKSDLSDSPILFTHFVPHTVAASGVWANYVIPSDFIGALPFDVNFCTITFGKEDITSAAYGWFVGDIFFSEAQQEDLWATTRGFIPTLYGASVSDTPAIANVTHIRATRATAQTINSGVDTIFVFPTEVFDSLAEYDPATGRATISKAGYYRVEAAALFEQFAAAVGSVWQIALYKNGAIVSQGARPVAETTLFSYRHVMLADTILLAASDIIDVRIFQNTGAARTTFPGATWNYLNIHRIL